MEIIDKIKELKHGDLILVAYTNACQPAIFVQYTGVSVQYFPIYSYNLNRLKEDKKPYKSYINSINRYRIVKIDESQLYPKDLELYQEIKKYL